MRVPAKWIVTGGAGFIGSHATSRLLALGHDVVVIDDLSRRGSKENLTWLRACGLRHFARVDVRDRIAIDALLRRHGDADVVLHLASQAAVTTSIVDPRNDFEINALGTLNVLEGVRLQAGCRPAVLYSSTNKVYGALDELAIRESDTRYSLVDRAQGIDETQPLSFHSPYGCSKGAGEQYVTDYARIYGIKTVVFRQSCIYGPHQFGVEDQGWIAWLLIAAMLGRPFTLYGSGKQVRDALWVEDLVDVYLLAQERIDRVAGQVFNIGGGQSFTLSLLELVAWLETRLARRLEPRHRDRRPGDQRVFVSCNAKAERLLDWRPRIAPEQGLERLLRWIEDNRSSLELG